MRRLTKEERNWAMLSHLLALVGYFVIPFGNVVAPLIIYLMKKVVGVAGAILTIIAAVKAANGEAYRYPLTLRLIS